MSNPKLPTNFIKHINNIISKLYPWGNSISIEFMRSNIMNMMMVKMVNLLGTSLIFILTLQFSWERVL